MTSYVAHHTKKKQILARKETALQRLIDAGAPVFKLVAAAEKVRDARIRVLHVQRSVIVPKDEADVQYAKIDRKIAVIVNTSTATILAEFGCDLESMDSFGCLVVSYQVYGRLNHEWIIRETSHTV